MIGGLGVALGIAVGVAVGTAVGLAVGTDSGSRVGTDTFAWVGAFVATVVGVEVATIVGETSADAACAEGPIEVGDRSASRVGVAGKSGVAQPAATAKLSTMKPA